MKYIYHQEITKFLDLEALCEVQWRRLKCSNMRGCWICKYDHKYSPLVQRLIVLLTAGNVNNVLW